MRSRRLLRPRALPRLLALVGMLLGLAACEVRAELNITVEEGGSGVVELALALDEEAASRRPDLLEELDLSDLTDTGWEVTGPGEEADGSTWIRARHSFSSPEELGPLVEEVAGADGPVRDVQLTRDDGFAETRYSFAGTVDFTAGAAALAEDPELAEALGAEPIELLEQRLGAAIDEMIRVQVAVRMPGSVSSNAPTQASNGAVWRPSVVDREAVTLQATSTVGRTERWIWVGVAIAAGFALVLYVLIRVAEWRRRASSASSTT